MSNQWDERLRKTGFSGIDLKISGQEDLQCQFSSIIISSAVGCITEAISTLQAIALLRDTRVEAQCMTAKLLEVLFAKLFPVCKTYTLSELAKVDTLASTMTVFLMEMNANFLDGVSATDYNHFHSILTRSKNTVWVTKTTSSESKPQHHLADGLGRTLASEDFTRKFVTLALDGLWRAPEHMANVISELVKRVAESPVEQLETNYVATRGMLHISRISENSPMNIRVAQAILPRQREKCRLTADTRISLHLGSPGHLRTLEWMSCEEASNEPTLDEDEVLVEVRSFGLTWKDCLVASGQLNELDLGTECAGVVQAAGHQSSFHPGDRVCLVGTSTSRSVVRANASAVTAIPSELSFVEAASMSSALWLSYHALVNVAKLQEGEIALICQGYSSVGQMAIQLAKKLGAGVLITTNSASECGFLSNQLNVPERTVFHKEDVFVLSKIHQATNGQGVDVVIGSFVDESDLDFSKFLAPFGRLVNISVRQQTESSTVPSGNATMNMSRASVHMVDFFNRKPAMAHETFQLAMKIGFEGGLRPPQPLHVFQADEIEAVFRHFQYEDMMGKTIVELRPGTALVVRFVRPLTHAHGFDILYR